MLTTIKLWWRRTWRGFKTGWSMRNYYRPPSETPPAGHFPVPSEVNICGIKHRVAVHEGMVVFSEMHPMAFNPRRVCFEKSSGLWHMWHEGGFSERATCCHIEKMYRLVRGWFGDDHDMRPVELTPAESTAP